MIKKISLQRIMIYILVGILLFQDSIINILQVNAFNYIDEVFILITFFYGLFHMKKIPKYTLILISLVLLFWFTGFFSALINSQVAFVQLIPGSFLMIKFFLLVISVSVISPKEKIIKVSKEAIYFWGWVSAFAGIINVISISFWQSVIPYAIEYKRLGINSAQGLFVHSNQYGWFMLFVAILYFSDYYYDRDKSKIKNVIIMAFFAVLSMKVKVITAIPVLIFFVLFVLEKKISMKKLLLILLGSTAILGIFGELISDTFIQYFTNTGSDVSARYALLNGGLRILRDFFPLGVGFSKFGSYYASVYYSEYYHQYGLSNVWGLRKNETFFGTDTFWPAIFGETGFLGTAVYIIILILIFKILLYGLKTKTNDIEASKKLFFACLVLIQALVESTGEPIFNSAPQNIFIGLAVGTGIAAVYRKNKLTEK